MLRTKSWMLGLLLITFTGPVAHAVDVLDYVEGEREASVVVADTLWDLAELGYLEEKSSKTLQNYLAEREFIIESSVADIPTAFVARYGSGGPTIALLAEFDALPGLTKPPYRNVWSRNKAHPDTLVAIIYLAQPQLQLPAH